MGGEGYQPGSAGPKTNQTGNSRSRWHQAPGSQTELAASAVVSPPPTRGHRVRGLAQGHTRHAGRGWQRRHPRGAKGEACRRPAVEARKGGSRAVKGQAGGGRRRAGLKQVRVGPEGGRGRGLLPARHRRLPPLRPPCAAPASAKEQRVTSRRPGRKGGRGRRAGSRGACARGASSGRAEVALSGRGTRRPPGLRGPHIPAPRSPTPTQQPGRAHVGRGSGPGGPGPGLGPRGQGAGAAAQGSRSRPGWRRMRGEGVGGPGRARTWRLYLQSPSVRAAEPHAAAQT